ncbi:MAG: hypothetical protein ABII25_05995 [bacterium]
MKKGQKAWLVIWEWAGSHARVEDKIAAILRPWWSEERVGQIVETLYALHQYTPRELAIFAKQPKKNPYKAQWHNGYCSCGANPSLHASYVENLIIEEDSESGFETISWVMPPLLKINKENMKTEEVRGPLPKQVKRTIAGPLSDREIGRRK